MSTSGKTRIYIKFGVYIALILFAILAYRPDLIRWYPGKEYAVIFLLIPYIVLPTPYLHFVLFNRKSQFEKIIYGVITFAITFYLTTFIIVPSVIDHFARFKGEAGFTGVPTDGVPSWYLEEKKLSEEGI